MGIVWKETLDQVDWHEMAALFRAAPLGDKDPGTLNTAFSNSMFTCLAYEDGRLIAAGRVLADGVDCAYLCDIAVLPSHQGLGLGKKLIEHLVKKSKSHKKIFLYSVPGKEAIYEKFGFRRMNTAMAIFEDQKAAEQRGYIKGPGF